MSHNDILDELLGLLKTARESEAQAVMILGKADVLLRQLETIARLEGYLNFVNHLHLVQDGFLFLAGAIENGPAGDTLDKAANALGTLRAATFYDPDELCQ